MQGTVWQGHVEKHSKGMGSNPRKATNRTNVYKHIICSFGFSLPLYKMRTLDWTSHSQRIPRTLLKKKYNAYFDPFLSFRSTLKLTLETCYVRDSKQRQNFVEYTVFQTKLAMKQFFLCLCPDNLLTLSHRVIMFSGTHPWICRTRWLCERPCGLIAAPDSAQFSRRAHFLSNVSSYNEERQGPTSELLTVIVPTLVSVTEKCVVYLADDIASETEQDAPREKIVSSSLAAEVLVLYPQWFTWEFISNIVIRWWNIEGKLSLFSQQIPYTLNWGGSAMVMGWL